MKKYTVDDIMALKPCRQYSRERVVELWDGRDALEPREIAKLAIPKRDILWAIVALDIKRRNLTDEASAAALASAMEATMEATWYVKYYELIELAVAKLEEAEG